MGERQRGVGEIFRAKREEMNLSLKEVENATSIRMLYLQAIEEGKIQQFISSVYALGFIRQYGGFLGFDCEVLAREYPEAFRIVPEKQDFSYGIGTLEIRGAPQGRGRWMPGILWSGGFALLGLLAWMFSKWMGAF